MKRILLSTTLLLLAGLCGSSARAAYTQLSESTTLVAPTPDAIYTAYSPNTTAQVPVSITNQWVNVSGDPSTIVTVQWSMVDYAAQYGGNAKPVYAAQDWSNGPTQVGIDQTGNWRRYVNNNGTGNLSTNITLGTGYYSFNSGSLIEGSSQSPATTQTVNFTVDQAV